MQIWQNDAMKCPNCSKPLQPEKIGSTVYWRCSSCGALWFDNKENDFLTEDEAKKLSGLSPQPSFGKLEYHCPRDKSPLKFDQYYYRCYTCGGVMAAGGGILEEKTRKRAQTMPNIKKPIGLNQMKHVVIFALAIVFVGLNISLVSSLRHRYSLTTQASEIESNLQIRTVSKSKLAIYFTTTEPYRTTAKFTNSQKSWEKMINSSYSLNHFLIVEKPELPTTVEIQLVSIEGASHQTKPVALTK